MQRQLSKKMRQPENESTLARRVELNRQGQLLLSREIVELKRELAELRAALSARG